MPSRSAIRLGLFARLLFVPLFFFPTVVARQKGIASQSHMAPAVKPADDGDREDGRFVVHSDLISFNVTVTDNFGRHIGGLPQSAFTVLDGNRAQQISLFTEDDSPVTIGIVFDLTGSMTEKKLKRAREALAHFMETSHESDEYYLLTMQDGRVTLSLDSTRDHMAVVDKLTHVSLHGKTALYDACYLGLNKVLRGTYRRRALLLISDGQDNNSLYTFDELRQLLTESDVTVYSISVADKGNDPATLNGEKILRDVAAVSGGKFFQPESAEEMYEVFERIALELRRQYAIAYRPSNFASDGKWHSLKVKLTPPSGLPRLFVRYRSGYYALSHPR